jgi:arylsulfatase A-like enzyme
VSLRRATVILPLLLLGLGCERDEWMGRFGRGGPAASDAPNVLVVSLDTLRADRLASNGYERETAPTLSKLAAEGGSFSRVWSQAPATDGTHASLFSGRHIATHGKFSHRQRLGDRELTFAEHFRENGYRTFAVATSLKFLTKSGFDQGFESWDLHGEGKKNARGTDALDDAVDHIELGAAPGSEPWLGFVHFFDVHAPYSPPKPHKSAFLRGPLTLKPGKSVFYIRRHRRDRKVPKKHLNTLSDLYDGGIQYVDTRVKRLLEAVQDNDRPTIVVLFSDHGEAFHEHRYLGHDNVVWDEVTRVPWIVWAPDRVLAGQRIDTTAQTVDLYPTITELAGLSTPPDLDGSSFGPALRGEANTVATDRIIPIQDDKMWGLVVETDEGLFKLHVRIKKRKLTLYNLTRDPGETVDVQAAHPELMEQLVAELERLNIRRPDKNSIQRDDITADEEEALRAIGYVD